MLGLTQATVIPFPPPEPKKEAAGKPIAPLLREVEQLKLQTSALDAEIRALEKLLPQLQEEVKSLQPTQKEKPAESSPGD